MGSEPDLSYLRFEFVECVGSEVVRFVVSESIVEVPCMHECPEPLPAMCAQTCLGLVIAYGRLEFLDP